MSDGLRISTGVVDAFTVDPKAPIKKDPTHFVLYKRDPNTRGWYDPRNQHPGASDFCVVAEGSLAECVIAAQRWVEQHGGSVKIARVESITRAEARLVNA